MSDHDTDVARAARPPRLGSLAVRLELGMIAFTPVMALLAVRTRHDWLWLVFATPAAVGCAIAVGYWATLRGTSPEPYRFDRIDDAGNEVLGHIGSYLLPVVIDIGSSSEEVVIAACALALIVQIHVMTGRVHVNPLLYLFGYRVYRAVTDTGVSYSLIARSDVTAWTGPHPCAPIGSSILVERRPPP